MKKFKTFYFIFLLAIITSFFNNSALANSAAPMSNEFGASGIFFEKSESIGINKEILDIIVDDEQIKYTATYQMENLTDQSLNIFTMFMIPQKYNLTLSTEELIDVTQDGQSLKTRLNVYFSTLKNDNWEDILNKSSFEPQSLGDGTGFYKFYINVDSFVKFTATSHFYVVSNDYNYDNNTKECTLLKSTEVITRQDLSEFAFKKDDVPNVYNTIFINHDSLSEIDKKAVMKFYFSEITADNFEMINIDSVYYNFNNSVHTIDYNLSFSPKQKSNVAVTYSFKLPKKRNNIEINYLLSPAKYWNNFENLTINLSLNSHFSVIESSSLQFSKVSKNKYEYKSSSLPQNDLNMMVRKTKFNSFFYNITMALPYILLLFVIYILPVCLIIIGIVIVIKFIKKRKIS